MATSRKAPIRGPFSCGTLHYIEHIAIIQLRQQLSNQGPTFASMMEGTSQRAQPVHAPCLSVGRFPPYIRKSGSMPVLFTVFHRRFINLFPTYISSVNARPKINQLNMNDRIRPHQVLLSSGASIKRAKAGSL